MPGLRILIIVLAAFLNACALSRVDQEPMAPRDQVLAAERAFAQSMADRDLRAFSSFVSEEAVFFSGPTPLRGREQVVAWWARYFMEPQAPFSWEPDEIEVLGSADLALSSGPVKDPSGRVIARFTSIWRLESPGTWRIVFDRGSPVASPAPE